MLTADGYVLCSCIALLRGTRLLYWQQQQWHGECAEHNQCSVLIRRTAAVGLLSREVVREEPRVLFNLLNVAHPVLVR